MKFNDIRIILETKSTPVVVVDVQPEYSGINDGAESQVFQDIIDFVGKQTGNVLLLCNAEDQGLSSDTVADIQLYWEDSGFDPVNWNRVDIIDKGYGYLRSFMDQGISDRSIIKLIREMYQHKVTDSRELSVDTLKQCVGSEYQDWMEDSDAISVEWLSVAKLKQFNNCYLIGGGREECLKEVALLMNAFNIKYKLINELIYG